MEAITPSSNHSLLTRREAAGKLRVSLNSLDRLISKKNFSTVSVGKRRLIPEEQLASFIQKGGGKC